MASARGIAQGVIEWDQDVSEHLYACTLCGYCEDLCDRGYRHTPAVSILEELRRMVPEKLKPKGLKGAADSVKVPENHKLSILKEYGLPDLSRGGSADTVLFADTSIMVKGAKLKELGFLIKKSGRRVGYFGENPLPPVEAALLNGGCQEVLEASLGEIDSRLRARGLGRVICYNPESLSVLARFSKSGAQFISITGLYAEMLKKKPHKKLKLKAVTYQDPCHLGRYAKEYVAPRQVIEGLGLTLKEMWRSRQDSLCCGAGGGVLGVRPELAKRYAANRWEEGKATGAKVMVSACPYCEANLRRAKPRGSQVVDITSLVAQAYGFKGKAVVR
jgi:Fe-S oxidoreductase